MLSFKNSRNRAIVLLIFIALFLLFFWRFLPDKYKAYKLSNTNYSNLLLSNLESSSSGYVREIRDSSDFSVILKEVQNKKIIILGDQQHGDGGSAKVKSDLIKYLSKHGFNVLLFESPLFRTYSLYTNYKLENKKQDPSKSLYSFWGKSNELASLRNDILNSDNLEFGGIDFQIPYEYSQPEIAAELKSYLIEYPDFVVGEYASFWESLENSKGPILLFNTPKQQVINKDSCMHQLKKLLVLVSNRKNKTDRDSFFQRYLYNIYQFYHAKIKFKNSQALMSQFRDSMMFDNLKWQINTNYKDRKIIIWTANFHGTYSYFQNNPDNLGGHIKQHFGRNVFSILFTSYQGSTTNITSLEKSIVNQPLSYTLEAALHRKNHKLTFIKCPTGQLDSSAIAMRFYGYNNQKETWFKQMDSFIYIDEMTPMTF